MIVTLAAVLSAALFQQDSAAPLRTIAIDEVFAEKAHLNVGDRLAISSRPGTSAAEADSVVIGAIFKRSADPSEVARAYFKVGLHLDHLQQISGYGDRVDRFALATTDSADIARTIERINAQAFGFRAYRSRDIAVETSRTFLVVSRFHRAIGVITIVASSVFLLCIMILKVEERRRDIAALRLMGISRTTVAQTIVIEAALVAVLGSALGVLLGWLVSLYVNAHYKAIYNTPLEFSIITPPIIVFAVSLSLVLGIAAGLAASLRLVRTPPLTLFGR